MVATAGHRVLLRLDNLLCGYSYRSMEYCPSQSMFRYVCQNFSVGLPASVKKQHEIAEILSAVIMKATIPCNDSSSSFFLQSFVGF